MCTKGWRYGMISLQGVGYEDDTSGVATRWPASLTFLDDGYDEIPERTKDRGLFVYTEQKTQSVADSVLTLACLCINLSHALLSGCIVLLPTTNFSRKQVKQRCGSPAGII